MASAQKIPDHRESPSKGFPCWNGDDIDAKVPGFGAMQLKSSVVKKVA